MDDLAPTGTLIRASAQIDRLYARTEARLCDGSRVPVCLGIEAKIISTDVRLDRDELCRLSLDWLTGQNGGFEMLEGITDRPYTAQERERLARERAKAQALPCPFHPDGGDCLLGICAPLYSRVTPNEAADIYRDFARTLHYLHPSWRLLGFLPTYLAVFLAPERVQDLAGQHLIPDAKLAMFSLGELAAPPRVYAASVRNGRRAEGP